jgi:hypothetical protein
VNRGRPHEGAESQLPLLFHGDLDDSVGRRSKAPA